MINKSTRVQCHLKPFSVQVNIYIYIDFFLSGAFYKMHIYLYHYTRQEFGLKVLGHLSRLSPAPQLPVPVDVGAFVLHLPVQGFPVCLQLAGGHTHSSTARPL